MKSNYFLLVLQDYSFTCEISAFDAFLILFETIITIIIVVFHFFRRTIAYSVSETRFFVGKPPFVPVTRKLPITNTFSFTMVIYDAVFPPEVDGIFSVSANLFPVYISR